MTLPALIDVVGLPTMCSVSSACLALPFKPGVWPVSRRGVPRDVVLRVALPAEIETIRRSQMISSRAIAAVAAVVLSASGTGAFAALVEGAEGAISINRGDGFVAASATSNVEPGGLIMVAPGQTALITYPDGCKVKIGAGRVWAVEQVAPCPPGQPEIDFTSLAPDPQTTNITTGQVNPTGQINGPGAGAGEGIVGGLSQEVVIGGLVGLAAIGGGIAIANGSKSKSNTPSSP
jgi:hypothetical protein